MKEKKPECEECKRKATYKCRECSSVFCDKHCEEYNYECPYHDDPILVPII